MKKINSVFYLKGMVIHLCKNESAIVTAFIGHDIRVMAVDYESPRNVFDGGDGRRALQWVMRKLTTVPA